MALEKSAVVDILNGFSETVLNYYEQLNSKTDLNLNEVNQLYNYLKSLVEVTIWEDEQENCIIRDAPMYIEIILTFVSSTPTFELRQQKSYLRKYLGVLLQVFTGSRFRNKFIINCTEKVFNLFLYYKFNFVAMESMLALFNEIASSAKLDIRMETGEHLIHYVYQLTDALILFGDYVVQSHLIETVFHLFGFFIMQSKLSYPLFPNDAELDVSLKEVNCPDLFDEKVRLWLNRFNTKNPKILSLACQTIVVGDYSCLPPKGFDTLWVDFNVEDKITAFYCNSSNNSVNRVYIVTKYVKKVHINRQMGKKEAILFLKLLKPCVTNVDQSIWNTMHSHIKITIKNQDREISHLIRNVLPPLFGETFSHVSPKISYPLREVYKPLSIKQHKISVCRKSTGESTNSNKKSSNKELDLTLGPEMHIAQLQSNVKISKSRTDYVTSPISTSITELVFSESSGTRSFHSNLSDYISSDESTTIKNAIQDKCVSSSYKFIENSEDFQSAKDVFSSEFEETDKIVRRLQLTMGNHGSIVQENEFEQRYSRSIALNTIRHSLCSFKDTDNNNESNVALPQFQDIILPAQPFCNSPELFEDTLSQFHQDNHIENGKTLIQGDLLTPTASDNCVEINKESANLNTAMHQNQINVQDAVSSSEASEAIPNNIETSQLNIVEVDVHVPNKDNLAENLTLGKELHSESYQSSSPFEGMIKAVEKQEYLKQPRKSKVLANKKITSCLQKINKKNKSSQRHKSSEDSIEKMGSQSSDALTSEGMSKNNMPTNQAVDSINECLKENVYSSNEHTNMKNNTEGVAVNVSTDNVLADKSLQSNQELNINALAQRYTSTPKEETQTKKVIMCSISDISRAVPDSVITTNDAQEKQRSISDENNIICSEESTTSLCNSRRDLNLTGSDKTELFQSNPTRDDVVGLKEKGKNDMKRKGPKEKKLPVEEKTRQISGSTESSDVDESLDYVIGLKEKEKNETKTQKEKKMPVEWEKRQISNSTQSSDVSESADNVIGLKEKGKNDMKRKTPKRKKLPAEEKKRKISGSTQSSDVGESSDCVVELKEKQKNETKIQKELIIRIPVEQEKRKFSNSARSSDISETPDNVLGLKEKEKNETNIQTEKEIPVEQEKSKISNSAQSSDISDFADNVVGLKQKGKNDMKRKIPKDKKLPVEEKKRKISDSTESSDVDESLDYVVGLKEKQKNETKTQKEKKIPAEQEKRKISISAQSSDVSESADNVIGLKEKQKNETKTQKKKIPAEREKRKISNSAQSSDVSESADNVIGLKEKKRNKTKIQKEKEIPVEQEKIKSSNSAQSSDISETPDNVVELKEKEENNTKIQIQKGKRLPAEQEKRHIPSSTQSSEVSVSSDNGIHTVQNSQVISEIQNEAVDEYCNKKNDSPLIPVADIENEIIVSVQNCKELPTLQKDIEQEKIAEDCNEKGNAITEFPNEDLRDVDKEGSLNEGSINVIVPVTKMNQESHNRLPETNIDLCEEITINNKKQLNKRTTKRKLFDPTDVSYLETLNLEENFTAIYDDINIPKSTKTKHTKKRTAGTKDVMRPTIKKSVKPKKQRKYVGNHHINRTLKELHIDVSFKPRNLNWNELLDASKCISGEYNSHNNTEISLSVNNSLMDDNNMHQLTTNSSMILLEDDVLSFETVVKNTSNSGIDKPINQRTVNHKQDEIQLNGLEITENRIQLPQKSLDTKEVVQKLLQAAICYLNNNNNSELDAKIQAFLE